MARPRSDEARRKALDAARDLIMDRRRRQPDIEEVAARVGCRQDDDLPALARAHVAHHRHRQRPVRAHSALPTPGRCGATRGFFGAGMRVDLSGNVARDDGVLIEAAAVTRRWAFLLDRSSRRERVLRRSSSGPGQRGELHHDFVDLDNEHLVGIIVGPIVFQKLVRRRTLTPAYVNACLDVILAGSPPIRRWRRSGRRSSRHRPRNAIDGERTIPRSPSTRSLTGTVRAVSRRRNDFRQLDRRRLAGIRQPIQRDRLAANHLQGPG